MNKESFIRTFGAVFGSDPLVVRSPGRVNFIGEHTDYNQGFVLPAAIDKAIYVGVSTRQDNEVHLISNVFKEQYSTTLLDIAPTSRGWPNYILGVIDQLIKHNHTFGGFNLLIDGDVPLGAGLSSSAAVECATIFALNQLFALKMERMEMVKMAQSAEHNFAGVKCGIMDQFASMMGKPGHVIKLDCRSLEYEYVPLDLREYKIVLLNTNVKHSLASSEYNKRREECEQGVAWVRQYYPEVLSLRDVSLEMLRQYVQPKDGLIYKRCRYVVEENQRLTQGCENLKNGDLKALGRKMFQTHEGLDKEYEVSCAELNFLVNGVKGELDVLGARMMGGGFGGCTINLIKENTIDKILDEASRQYKKATGLEITAYVAQIEGGTEILNHDISA